MSVLLLLLIVLPTLLAGVPVLALVGRELFLRPGRRCPLPPAREAPPYLPGPPEPPPADKKDAHSAGYEERLPAPVGVLPVDDPLARVVDVLVKLAGGALTSVMIGCMAIFPLFLFPAVEESGLAGAATVLTATAAIFLVLAFPPAAVALLGSWGLDLAGRRALSE